MRRLITLLLLGLGLSNIPLESEDVTSPTVKRLIGMTYPRLAHFAAQQGKVELTAKIARNGSVENITVAAGTRPLTDAAKEALYRWQFFPCGGGTAETCEVRILFRFVLLDGTCDSTNCPSEFQFDFPNIVTVSAKYFAGPVQ